MTDRIRGKTIQWTFKNGPMAKQTFEHVFLKNGSLKFRAVDNAGKGKTTRVKKYDVAKVNSDVYAVSYLGPSGYTLSTVLDFRKRRLIAFASNEKSLTVQEGTFKVV